VIARFRFTPPAPYSLKLTAARFSRFPEIVDLFDGRTYRRLLRVDSRPVLLTVRQPGAVSKPILDVRLEGEVARAPAARAAARFVIERALGATVDLRPFYRALRSDPVLAPSLSAFRGLGVAGWSDVWEALVTTVLCQQVNLKFAYDIRRELAAALGLSARIGGKTFHAFPPPERLAEESAGSLRRFRLSRSKAETIRRLARAFARGELSQAELEALPDAAVVERLTAIKGIGTWTAETVLLRGLGRLDAFPAGDLGVVKYLAQGLFARTGRATEAEMRRRAESWRPWRGLALVYAYAELARRREG